MDYKELVENARKCLGKCHGCPICNGVACRNTIPGPGAKGVGDTAIRNYQAWQTVRVVMDTLCEKRETDTRLSLFGHSFAYPFFAGPVGAVAMHYSDKYNDVTYNAQLVPGCAESGILAFTGDGMDAEVMRGATDAIKDCQGVGIPTVKPWNMQMIREKMNLVKASGALAVAMDVDAAGLPFLKKFVPPAGSKSVEEMKEIIALTDVPFIVKGIMTVAGAKKALEAGAKGIVVPTTGDASWTRALLRPKSCRKSRLLWAARSKSLLTAGSVPALMFSRLLPWAPMPSLLPDLLSMLFMAVARKAYAALLINWGLNSRIRWKCAGQLRSVKLRAR